MKQHARNNNGRFRRVRGDALVKNLRDEYPQLKGIHGSTKLETLREEFGVDSLSKVLDKLDQPK